MTRRDIYSAGQGLLFLSILALGMTTAGHASGRHEGGHDEGAHHEGGEVGGHRHDNWPAPPATYAGRRSDRWADLDAIKRGRKLYRGQCMQCHGARGRGDGPLAASLPHPPADLTQHFHTDRKGDAYLFWRVSEGGTAEPFRSMKSAMPAFKNTLTEAERWDVLAYVHAFFHLGLIDWAPAGAGAAPRPQGGAQ